MVNYEVATFRFDLASTAETVPRAVQVGPYLSADLIGGTGRLKHASGCQCLPTAPWTARAMVHTGSPRARSNCDTPANCPKFPQYLAVSNVRSEDNMSVFGSIVSAIFGSKHGANAAPTAGGPAGSSAATTASAGRRLQRALLPVHQLSTPSQGQTLKRSLRNFTTNSAKTSIGGNRSSI